MKKEDLRIVYMGTPDFAVESLRALVEGGYNIVWGDNDAGQAGRSSWQCLAGKPRQAICPVERIAGAPARKIER